jgi:hypothetical protein
MAVLLCNSICFFINGMSKDAYEKGKTKIRHNFRPWVPFTMLVKPSHWANGT